MTSTTTELAYITAQMARFTAIRVTALREGMIGTTGEISNLRETWIDDEVWLLWEDIFGRTRGGRKSDGWVDVTRDSVSHKTHIKQVPVYAMGCYTGNSDNTAVCSCGWESENTSSSFMVNRWAAEHEQGLVR